MFNSNITLKVKSGPGEIIGVTEIEANNNLAEFTNIQFSDPGEYIISVIPSNSDLEPTEFTINILPEDEIIPQDETPEKEPIVTGNRPIITQIDQPSVNLNPIEFESSPNNKYNENVVTSIGVIPFIWYNGLEIKSADIKSFILYYDNMLPKCTIVVVDSFGYLNSPETTPTSNTKFEIFLSSGSKILKSIHLRFKLEINQKNKDKTNTITGILDLSDFYKVNFKSYQGTSFEVLKSISMENNLGFNSNIINTNDSMKWIRNNKTNTDFIIDIINHSYLSDDSFMLGYIDYYWCFNYVDIEKEWKRDISNDTGIISTGFSSVNEKEKLENLILTNDKSMSTSPFYFTNHKLNNNSTFLNTNGGVYTVSKSYDPINKSFLEFNINPLRSDTDNNLVLSGSILEKEDIDNKINVYHGRVDDNVHPNYLYSIEQNNRNIQNLLNISMSVELPNPNYNLYKYQKVMIYFVNKNQTITNEKLNDERLSGEWLIIDISYRWRLQKLTQSLVLVRKELGKTKNEINNQVIKEDNKVDNSEMNENPDIT